MRALLVTGVLGVGTALVFGLAALTATLFPSGTVVSQAWPGGWMERGGWGIEPVPMPLPGGMDPTLVDPDIMVEGDGFEPLPGDTVGGWDERVIAEPAVP